MRDQINRAFTILVMLLVVTVAGVATGTEEAGTGSAGLDEIGFNATGMPIVDEQVTIRVAAVDFWNTPDFGEKLISERWEEMTNVVIDWQHLPGGDEQAQVVNIMFASADLPDAFFSAEAATSRAAEYGAQGLVLPLNEMVAMYGPNIEAVFDEVPEARARGTSPDGNLYRIHHVNQIERRNVQNHLQINTAWLDAVGLDPPTTTDEFEEVLRAFKTQDPNGNGEADEIPFTSLWTTTPQGMVPLFAAFDTTSAFELFTVTTDGQVQVGLLEPGYIDAVEYFNGLYEEELIDIEVFVQDGTAWSAKTREKPYRVGSWITWAGWNAAGDLESSIRDFTLIEPLAGPRGTRAWGQQTSGTGWFASMITNQAEYPEVILRWIDNNFVPENGIQWLLGPFGVNIEEKADGRWGLTATPEGMGYGAFRTSETFVFAPSGIPNSWVTERWVPNDRGEYKSSLVDAYMPYASYYWNVDDVSILSSEEQEEIATYLSDIKTFVQNQEAEWVTNGGIRGEYDAFVAQLERMNIGRVRELYQIGVDRYFDS